jgi:hypothetical protein
MKTFTAIVQNGAVKLPPAAQITDGARVLVTVLDEAPRDSDLPPYPPDLEAEDVAFVQACRGRLARHLRDEEA